MKNEKKKIELDLHSETHRNKRDCTCFECMKQETKEFINENRQRTNSNLQDSLGQTGQ